jgi:hypothetical protein
MGWGVVIVCGLIVWASCGGVYAMGREVWPGEMPEVVRLAVAPVIAAAATLADELIAPEFNSLLRAVAFTLIAAALDAILLAPLIDGHRGMFRSALGAWLPLAAIFAATLLTGAFVHV